MSSQTAVFLINDLLTIFNKDKHTKTAVIKPPKYTWNWNEKLSASPFRKEIKRLKEENKSNPAKKKENNAWKRVLKAQEKQLLAEFEIKCNQAKIWINEAHKDMDNQKRNSMNGGDRDLNYLQNIAIQRKKDKIEAIDQFWDELILHQTAFIQSEVIRKQRIKMMELEKETKAMQAKLAAMNKKKGIKQSENVKKETPKKKKKKKNKEEYLGLVGYFNKSQKKSSKEETETKSANVDDDTKKSEKSDMGFLSYSYVPKGDDDGEEHKVYEKNEKTQKEKKKKNKSMKSGFLSGGKKGLYDDKKDDSELSVDELNLKNRKQIEDMGFGDAVDNPFYTWERPKDDQKDKK